MGRDWSEQRRRAAGKRAAGEAVERSRYLAELEAPDEPPSKAELRAQAEAAVAAYRGPVRRLPTIIDLRCLCGHRGRVSVPPGRPRPRFRCRKCGRRL